MHPNDFREPLVKTIGKKIPKFPSILTLEVMYHIRRTYLVLPWVGFCSSPLAPYWNWQPIHTMVHYAQWGLKSRLKFAIPRVVARFLSTYDMSLALINPNDYRTLLSLDVVNRELIFKLEEPKIWAMYYVKRNRVDKGMAYVSTNFTEDLILGLPNSQGKWKEKYFYVDDDIWGGNVYLQHMSHGIIILTWPCPMVRTC